MTTTTIGKKFLILTTIAVAVTSLTRVTIIEDAEAGARFGTQTFRCVTSSGSFFPPPITFPDLFASAGVKCSLLGSKTSLASILRATGPGSALNCVALATSLGVDSFAISKLGWAGFSMEVEQCFFNSTGGLASPGGTFCGPASDDPWTSEATGTFTTTGGLVRGRPVVPGDTGTVSSDIDHCAMGGAPFGNFMKTKLKGKITLGDRI